MPGAWCTRSLACEMGREHTRSSPWVHRSNPAFPHTMVLTVSFVISSVIGLCCHRRFACTKLDASVEASGPHDFAVRVQHRSSAVLTIASIASRPASVTIASAPRWDETAPLGKCFASERKQDIFAQRAGQVICENAPGPVIASAAKQSSFEQQAGLLRRLAPSANASRLSQAMTEHVVAGWPRMHGPLAHR